MAIDVILCDDHKMFIDALMNVLESYPEINIEGYARNGDDLQEMLQAKQADVVVLDINMQHTDGISTTQWIKNNVPKVKVLILSMHEDYQHIKMAINAGANGYLFKNTDATELVVAIKSIYSGVNYFNREVINRMIAPESVINGPVRFENILSERELAVMKLIVHGKSNTEIAEDLYISAHTVNSHRKNIFRKLNINNTVSLIKLAVKNNLF